MTFLDTLQPVTMHLATETDASILGGGDLGYRGIGGIGGGDLVIGGLGV